MADDLNIEAQIAKLQRAGAQQIARAMKAVDQFGQMVLGNAAEHAPVDTGDLKASASDLPAEEQDKKITKTIGFGVSYAVYVHENLNAHHPQGEAKFLELSMRDLESRFAPFVADQMKSGGNHGG